jgi:hypothetical protein
MVKYFNNMDPYYEIQFSDSDYTSVDSPDDDLARVETCSNAFAK